MREVGGSGVRVRLGCRVDSYQHTGGTAEGDGLAAGALLEGGLRLSLHGVGRYGTIELKDEAVVVGLRGDPHRVDVGDSGLATAGVGTGERGQVGARGSRRGDRRL